MKKREMEGNITVNNVFLGFCNVVFRRVTFYFTYILDVGNGVFFGDIFLTLAADIFLGYNYLTIREYIITKKKQSDVYNKKKRQ